MTASRDVYPFVKYNNIFHESKNTVIIKDVGLISSLNNNCLNISSLNNNFQQIHRNIKISLYSQYL